VEPTQGPRRLGIFDVHILTFPKDSDGGGGVASGSAGERAGALRLPAPPAEGGGGGGDVGASGGGGADRGAAEPLGVEPALHLLGGPALRLQALQLGLHLSQAGLGLFDALAELS